MSEYRLDAAMIGLWSQSYSGAASEQLTTPIPQIAVGSMVTNSGAVGSRDSSTHLCQIPPTKLPSG